MQTSQLGDRVRVHYTKRFADGTMRSSRSRGDAPLELVVGRPHPRLPGVGPELVGLTNGDMVTIQVPAERAYGLPDPARIRRVDRARFPADEELKIGGRVWMRVSRGRTRRVRVLEISDGAVVVDANHPRCGQSVRVVVELVAIVDSTPELGSWDA